MSHFIDSEAEESEEEEEEYNENEKKKLKKITTNTVDSSEEEDEDGMLCNRLVSYYGLFINDKRWVQLGPLSEVLFLYL